MFTRTRHIPHDRTGRPRAHLRWTAAAVTAAALLGSSLVAAPAAAAPEDPYTITVARADVEAAAQNVNGLTFKGFGVLSANSTSALLLDYKAQHPEAYWELIETLFGGPHPVMNTIKIELGNDRNTSTGPNAATMRSRAEYPNVQREPGFQLAADAQLVAEGDIHLSLLRWTRPAWVQNHADEYIWFKNTALAAYREYGIMVDSINPDFNENHNLNASQSVFKNFTAWVQADTEGYEGAASDDPNNGWASTEEEALFKRVETVAGDTVGQIPQNFGDALHSDASLRDSIDVLATHYSSNDPNNNMKRLVIDHDKEVWNSEGQATFSNSADRPNNMNSDEQGGIGTEFGGPNSALEMGNWITTGFAHSYRTLTIYQPALGAFYEGFQYSSKELVSARDPWSGWLHYDGGLAVLEHFTQFATLGWENEDNTAGIWRGIPQASGSTLGLGNPPSGSREGRPSFTTLAAPDGSDFSTVFINDSKYEKTYRIDADDLDLGADETLELWETRSAGAGQAYHENYLTPVAELQPNGDGAYVVSVKPWSAVTATTLDNAEEAGGRLIPREGYGYSAPTSPEYTAAGESGREVLDTDATGAVNGVRDDDILYADDFDYAGLGNIQTYDPATGALVDSGESFLDSRGATAKPAGTPEVTAAHSGATPRYTNDTNGAFESVATSDPERDRVLRQQIGPGMVGGAWNGGDPKTTIGDLRWANYEVSVDVLFEEGSGRYATIGARQQGGTANGANSAAAELRIDPDGAWSLLRFGNSVASGHVGNTVGTDWASGSGQWNTIAVQVAGNVYTARVNGVEIVSYTDPAPQASGRIQLGSAFTFTQFDNLVVRHVDGYTPYYSDLIDGMHQRSWDDSSVPVLQFDENWNHVNGQGMYELLRTASRSTAQGAELAYTFTGTGLDIIGANSGQTTLDATVDGIPLELAAPTWSAGSSRTTFTLRGLEHGAHTVVLRTANSSSINVDAVGVITATADSSAVDTAAITHALGSVPGPGDAEQYSPGSWAAFDAIRSSAQRAVADSVAFGLDVEGAAALAARVIAAAERLVPEGISDDVQDLGVTAVETGTPLPEVLDFDGSEVQVVWQPGAQDSLDATAPLDSVTLTGRTGEQLEGVYQRFSVTVLVVPDELTYFIDSGSNSSTAGSAYAAVHELVPELRNDAADQQWDGAAPGSTWGYATTASVVERGAANDWRSSFLGADYNRPITYHLTLPEGTYNIVTVQAPRAGLTTQLYSTVRAEGHEQRVTATSTGAATPIAQQLTIDAEDVVSVEFGTNGTSGYNARLALIYVQQVQRDLGVQGALQADQALPDTVTIEGTEVPVEWDAEAGGQDRVEYELLTVTGTAGGQRISAKYEVIPESLVYYIDAGTDGTDSPQYLAVQDAVPGLLNQTADRVSPADDQWGHIAEGIRRKLDTSIDDKFSTGLYQDTTRLVYLLPLEAGTYELTAGFTEWWGRSRTMNHTVSAEGEELARGNVPLSGANPRLSERLTFTLDAPTTVEYLVTNEGAGAERPVISWLAVANLEAPAETLALQPTVTPRCLAGKVYLYTSVSNADDVPVDLSVQTAHGTKQVDSVLPGRSASAAFNSRLAAIDAGSVHVTATAADGREFAADVPYPATECEP